MAAVSPLALPARRGKRRIKALSAVAPGGAETHDVNHARPWAQGAVLSLRFLCAAFHLTSGLYSHFSFSLETYLHAGGLTVMQR